MTITGRDGGKSAIGTTTGATGADNINITNVSLNAAPASTVCLQRLATCASNQQPDRPSSGSRPCRSARLTRLATSAPVPRLAAGPDHDRRCAGYRDHQHGDQRQLGRLRVSTRRATTWPPSNAPDRRRRLRRMHLAEELHEPGRRSHTFAVRATNQVGTTDGSPATHTWSVASSAARTPSLDHEPPASTSATEANFEFSSSDASASFECRLDGGAWAAQTSPKALTGLAVGDHTFDVRSIANGKTDSSPASTSWTVTTPGNGSGRSPGCKPVAPKASLSKPVKVGKGVKVSVKLSHPDGSRGSGRDRLLLVNGKAPRRARPEGRRQADQGR